jgi:hypothetical protein
VGVFEGFRSAGSDERLRNRYGIRSQDVAVTQSHPGTIKAGAVRLNPALSPTLSRPAPCWVSSQLAVPVTRDIYIYKSHGLASPVFFPL